MSLEVKHLTIAIDTGIFPAQDISFQIPNGKMLAIVGSSGAGKTTVCKAVMGLLGTSYTVTGEILFQSKNLLQLAPVELRKIYGNGICYIMQNPMTAFNPSIRIGKQLWRTYRLHHESSQRAEFDKRMDEILQNLGLDDTKRILKSYPFALSGGMLQRLMIAAALINQPHVLIADEATTAIDACNRAELMAELRALCDKGMTILFVTHDLRAAAMADQILIMDHGHVVEAGTTKEILRSPKEEYTKRLLSACVLERR